MSLNDNDIVVGDIDIFVKRYLGLVAPRGIMYSFDSSIGFVNCERFDWDQRWRRILLVDNKKKLIASLRADFITHVYFVRKGKLVSHLYEASKV